MPAYSTVQAGSTVIGSATGDSLIVASGDADQFGIGASVIVWPAGQPLEAATPYDTMDITDKTGNTLTVLRNQDHALDTIAAGDQVGLQFATEAATVNQQTQILTVGQTDGTGPTIYLGDETVGLISVSATISDVNLDGGSTGSFALGIGYQSSFDGSNWPDPSTGKIVVGSGFFYGYYSFQTTFEFDSASDPSPLYLQVISSPYLRFSHTWTAPTDLGAAASATVTLKIIYV